VYALAQVFSLSYPEYDEMAKPKKDGRLIIGHPPDLKSGAAAPAAPFASFHHPRIFGVVPSEASSSTPHNRLG
jgi:hypothetical protein